MRGAWPGWRLKRGRAQRPRTEPGDPSARHLAQARDSLAELLSDRRLPPEVREQLADDFRQIEAMLDKLEHGHVHIAVFGRVSVGKSSLLNALLGKPRFGVSALHGETRHADMARWEERRDGGLFLIDTPGINEIGGELREQLAHEVAGRSDLVLFVIDGDITDAEYRALRLLAAEHRPLLLVLNKADRYTAEERAALREAVLARLDGLIAPDNYVEAAADPAPRIYVTRTADGRQTEEERRPPPQLSELKARLWEILEAEGKTLAALNAGLFASRLSDKVGERVLAVRRRIGQRIIQSYCLAKGIAVGVNPVPLTDLFAAVAVDVSMIVHLSQVYGLPMTRAQSGALIRTIMGQLALVMGTTWAVHLASSLLKAGTGGLSTLLTAGAQGAVAWYATYVVGQAAERYLAAGCSWGEAGPKRVVQEILDSIDRDSLLAQAREEILARLRG